MNRTIIDHQIAGLSDLNNHISIIADATGPGGASTRYDIVGDNGLRMGAEYAPFAGVYIRFQDGPIAKPEDMNGISNEALLAIVIDRLRGFQNGPFANEQNRLALVHLNAGLEFLQLRTRERAARGVEGSHLT